MASTTPETGENRRVSTDNQSEIDEPTQPPVTTLDVPKARGAFGRYRVMAFVTGGMLLLLCLEMLLKYVFKAGRKGKTSFRLGLIPPGQSTPSKRFTLKVRVS